MTPMLLALTLATAQADQPTPIQAATQPIISLEDRRVVVVDVTVPTRTITFDAARFNRLGFGDDLNDAWTLVPGYNSRTGTMADFGPGDVSVMLDGVLLRNQGRLSP